MEIGDGGMAMLGYLKMCGSQDSDEVAGLRKSLLDYCCLDTLGMVRLFEKLRDKANKSLVLRPLS